MDKLERINACLNAMSESIAEEKYEKLDVYVEQCHQLFQSIVDNPDDLDHKDIAAAYDDFLRLFDLLSHKKNSVSKSLLSSIKRSKGASIYKEG